MYPVTFAADYVERRSRLTTFFRFLLAIPHFIVLVVFLIIAEICVFIAWFAIVITGRYPAGLYGFVSRFVRYWTQVLGYTSLLTDAYPAFGGSDDYPIRMTFAGPLPQYSRLKTGFRFILEIPIVVLRYYVVGPLVNLGAFAAWFVILFTGKMPRGLQDMIVLGSSYAARSDAYVFLMTESYPPFREDMQAVFTGTTEAEPTAVP